MNCVVYERRSLVKSEKRTVMTLSQLELDIFIASLIYKVEVWSLKEVAIHQANRI